MKWWHTSQVYVSGSSKYLCLSVAGLSAAFYLIQVRHLTELPCKVQVVHSSWHLTHSSLFADK